MTSSIAFPTGLVFSKQTTRLNALLTEIPERPGHRRGRLVGQKFGFLKGFCLVSLARGCGESLVCTIVDHDTLLKEVTNLEHTFTFSLMWYEHSDFENVHLIDWDVFEIAARISSDCNCSLEDGQIHVNIPSCTYRHTRVPIDVSVSYLQECRVAKTNMDMSTVPRETQAKKPTGNLYMSHLCRQRWRYHCPVLPRGMWRSKLNKQHPNRTSHDTSASLKPTKTNIEAFAAS